MRSPASDTGGRLVARFRRYVSAARSDHSLITVPVALGIVMIGTTSATTPRAPAYRPSLGFCPSTSSVRNTGGIRPTNAPQHARIRATCPFAVKLSSDDSHHTQPAAPTTPTTSHTCRRPRRWNQVVRKVVVAIVSAVGTISQPAVVRG